MTADRVATRQWAADVPIAMHNTLNGPPSAAANIRRAEFASPAPPPESQI
ncbi:hypothetical protein Rhow_000513 [Rhodococcus wratislaviensis]|uniref:Uncharacterized protein n=1 Tax=Rhodococcus wratislaviensis TaxID=44752 RepID=A0A402CMN1_RHOWR|nr:hypothetical protein [Rhodococcus wratislaviensis]GCE44887.1 hypothetical protein Rhow_000513 [Rhodococcus wratislaviensis]